jgi:hypothetical protein
MKGTALSKLDAALGPIVGSCRNSSMMHSASLPTILGSNHQARPRRRGDQSVRGAARGSVRGKIESG